MPRDPPKDTFTRGLSPAKGGEQSAVAEVWFRYWEEVVRMYREGGKADRDLLYSLAADEAASRPLDYAADMREQSLRLEGGTIGTITSIDIDGDSAVIEGCFRDLSRNVDAQGKPVESAVVYFTTEDLFRMEGPDWRMTRNGGVDTGTPCSYR